MPFGDVHEGKVLLSDAGLMVEETYHQMLEEFSGITDVAHVIMPNHVHLLFSNDGDVNITDAVRWFKSKSTNGYIHGVKEMGWPSFDGRLWQTRFYDVILRNDVAHQYVLNYIANNPMRWSFDRLNFNADMVKAEI